MTLSTNLCVGGWSKRLTSLGWDTKLHERITYNSVSQLCSCLAKAILVSENQRLHNRRGKCRWHRQLDYRITHLYEAVSSKPSTAVSFSKTLNPQLHKGFPYNRSSHQVMRSSSGPKQFADSHVHVNTSSYMFRVNTGARCPKCF